MNKKEIEKAIKENQEITKAALNANDYRKVPELIMERGKLLQQLSEITIQEMETQDKKYREELKDNMFYNMFF